jgi:hypothetical protein
MSTPGRGYHVYLPLCRDEKRRADQQQWPSAWDCSPGAWSCSRAVCRSVRRAAAGQPSSCHAGPTIPRSSSSSRCVERGATCGGAASSTRSSRGTSVTTWRPSSSAWTPLGARSKAGSALPRRAGRGARPGARGEIAKKSARPARGMLLNPSIK